MYLFRFASAAPAKSLFIHLGGSIFHPLFVVLATVLAAIYGLTASYGLAIILLTIVIMALLMPLTVRSTRSMIAMQRVAPKIKRLQQQYKGSENREQLNRELMRVYKEERINPAGSCLPLLLQVPVLIVLYDVIKGLSNRRMPSGSGSCRTSPSCWLRWDSSTSNWPRPKGAVRLLFRRTLRCGRCRRCRGSSRSSLPTSTSSFPGPWSST